MGHRVNLIGVEQRPAGRCHGTAARSQIPAIPVVTAIEDQRVVSGCAVGGSVGVVGQEHVIVAHFHLLADF